MTARSHSDTHVLALIFGREVKYGFLPARCLQIEESQRTLADWCQFPRVAALTEQTESFEESFGYPAPFQNFFSGIVSMIVVISYQGHSFQSLNSFEGKVFWGGGCVCVRVRVHVRVHVCVSEDGEQLHRGCWKYFPRKS